jgi:hypothetical protein
VVSSGVGRNSDRNRIDAKARESLANTGLLRNEARERVRTSLD